ncbi:elongation factor Ts [Candidatus Roizmanbacteria bacterium CG02_land_8_20_14_3_00_36_15]|uniref:Elongation factor Ts n=2 Tax=Candidatus Roizmaniibacteriota TaxID=1752723 RepID=A0A2M8KKX7_9BACT|nr:MAG: elongation factor Ts [Candidatus Roizmanbacteria bacterium CG03_land_8_20_14_0_80_36_21]PIV38004.1 MAG: elongation factor Ts [Candidatus Roizmanbacteria bacterium CG02_land_8_20_14_3_00_36_15]PIY70119.1 MAG: elongation factor Ts [Candidatus Roizmanbacteria bacterium CG_4_10_14_0_8_um_filter_36_36]PJA52811.1 MAG: elongation factor Ts [Candidatus Roizmanbacteria bacterium CG_4_9_14_3_um_filter_36_11]PJC81852.1 MAG: elongation factor Ts [Candidatus Roizmanbacteria bacterium CG_4_8_14_3_um_
MVDIKKLKTLRKKTSISIALCKKALEESNNNLIKAEKLLKKWGAEKIFNKKNRVTKEGAIFSYVHHNKKIASLVELDCETDFVSANKDFLTLGQELAMQVASLSAKTTKELLKQEYIRDPSKKVRDLIKEAILKFGENIKINRIIRWKI